MNQPLVGIAIGTTGAFGTWNVSNNTIYNLNLASTSSSVGITSAGIFVSSVPPVGSMIAKNTIYGLNIATSNPNAVISGIEIAGGSMAYANNMIRIGLNAGGDITSPNTFNGIKLSSTAGNRIYFNSIYVGGSNVASSVFNSYALNRTVTSISNDSIRSNIFVNNRANATTGAKHYQVGLIGTTFLVMNNNVYFSDSLLGRTFAFNGTADVNPYAAGWAATDLNSYTSDPNFIAPTSATPNLHINTSLPAIVEQTGAPISYITDDYDGQVRSGLTPTDIGADAGNFINMICTAPPLSVDAAPSNNTPICGTGSKVYYNKRLYSNSRIFLSMVGIYNRSPRNIYGSFRRKRWNEHKLYNTCIECSNVLCMREVLCSGSSTFTPSDTVNIIINPNPTITILPVAGNVCDGALVNYTASGASTYTWSATDNTTPVPNGGANPKPSIDSGPKKFGDHDGKTDLDAFDICNDSRTNAQYKLLGAVESNVYGYRNKCCRLCVYSFCHSNGD